jgi:hypothetical protein
MLQQKNELQRASRKHHPSKSDLDKYRPSNRTRILRVELISFLFVGFPLLVFCGRKYVIQDDIVGRYLPSAGHMGSGGREAGAGEGTRSVAMKRSDEGRE